METYKEKLGKRIKSARTEADLSQADLGKAIGKKAGAVSKYERGASDPESEDLVLIADTCKISIDWLLTGREAPSIKPEPTREEALQQLLKIAMSGERKALLELCAEPVSNHTNQATDPQEQKLVEIFRGLNQGEKEKVLEIAKLYAGAKESPGKGRWESGLPESNCA